MAQTIKIKRSTSNNPSSLGFGQLAIRDSSGSVKLYVGNNSDTAVEVGGESFAKLASPAFTGTPTAPTQTAADNSTKVATTAYADGAAAGKQDTLVSGTNIKTVNGSSLLGSGNITISGGSTPGGTTGQIQYNDDGDLAGFTVGGDMSLDTSTGTATIANNAITNAKAAQMAAHTFKGNNTGSTANATDLTATQLTAELDAVVGDSGSGGTKGLVPAPGSGDASAQKYLKADGTWDTPSSTSGIPLGSIVASFASTAPEGCILADGSAVSRTTYAALFAHLITDQGFSPQTFTVTIASPAVFTKTGHGFKGGERERLATTGALPTGLNTNTDYFVKYIDANTYQVSTSLGGASINTTGSQSGTHTYLQSLFGLGDGATTFNLPDLRGQIIQGLDATPSRSLGTAGIDALTYSSGVTSASGITAVKYYIKYTLAGTTAEAFSTGSFIVNEIPTGLVNSSNTVFTLSTVPTTDVLLVVNGSVLKSGIGKDFTISSNVLTLAVAPTTGYNITASYGNNSVNNYQVQRNVLINGGFNVWQRGTSFATIASGTYAADRWFYNKSGAAVHTVTRDTDVPTVAQAGQVFSYSYKLACTTTDVSVAGGDTVSFTQPVEGVNFKRIAQKPIVLSFWVKAVKTGIYCVSIQNGSIDRSQVAEYTVNTTNTWEYKTVSLLATPSSGTWNYDTSVGLYVSFTLMSGTSRQTTAGAWQTGDYNATSNQVNACDNVANNFFLTGVQLEAGAVATPFEGRALEQEMVDCNRYYQKSYSYSTAPGTVTNTGYESAWAINTLDLYTYGLVNFAQRMRTAPTVAVYNPATGTAGQVRDLSASTNKTANINNVSEKGFNLQVTSAVAGNAYTWHYTASAEL